jgi:hypothetical protein
VQKILKVNFKEKHIRGGLATKLKYKSWLAGTLQTNKKPHYIAVFYLFNL